MNTVAKVALLVTSGQQKGARVILAPGEHILGASFESDIIVQDESLQSNKLKIEVRESGIYVQVLGDAEFVKTNLSKHSACKVDLYESLTFGSTTFVLGEPDTQEWQSYLNEDQALVTDNKNPAIDKSVGTAERRRFVPFAGACILVVAVSVLITNQYTQADALPTIEEQKSMLTAAFQDKGLNDVFPRGVNGKLIIDGYVGQYVDLYELKKISEALNLNVEFAVVVGEKLAADVSNVFRTNGINAKVELLGNGVAKVITTEADLDAIDHVKQIALRDITELKQIAIEQSTPEGVNSNDFLPGPGKRIIAVIQGDLSYFVTEDKSRYFIGSRLPSGFVVSGIFDDSVQLSKEGKQYNLPI